MKRQPRLARGPDEHQHGQPQSREVRRAPPRRSGYSGAISERITSASSTRDDRDGRSV